MKRTLLALLFFVGLIGLWAALVRAKIWSPVLLPSPLSVGEYLESALRDGTLLSATLVTLRRLLPASCVTAGAGDSFRVLRSRPHRREFRTAMYQAYT